MLKLFGEAKVSIKHPAQELTGGHCRKLLTYLVQTNYEGSGGSLFKSLKKVETYAVARILTEEEIGTFQIAIQEFSAIVKREKLTNTLKVHCLLYHVLPFVTKFKSWGIYSEQGKVKFFFS